MIVETTTTAPHTAAAVSAIAATVSVGSWMIEHAVFFTIGAAIVAVMSGLAACAFYCVSIYYKIKYESTPKVSVTSVSVTKESSK